MAMLRARQGSDPVDVLRSPAAMMAAGLELGLDGVCNGSLLYSKIAPAAPGQSTT